MRQSAPDIDVSIVLPCLNEEQTLPACIQAALRVFKESGLSGEVIVADNNSTDRSAEVAASEGARVVPVRLPGYGNALRGGIMAARGRFIVFLDADMSYDFDAIPGFVEGLRDGADMVIGSRFRGSIAPGSMPLLHRLVGTPALTRLANILFHCGITDINCGMRALRKGVFERLELHSEGMEFASEMAIKGARLGLRVEEIPIPFHMDQRGRTPHLRSFRDGWRHLELMMHYCSFWIFGLPALVLGIIGLALLLLPESPKGVPYLFAPVLTSVGTALGLLGVAAQGRVRAAKFSHAHHTSLWKTLSRWVHIETGLLLGGLTAGAGLAVLVVALFTSSEATFQGVTRVAALGTTLFMSGLLVFVACLFMGVFGIRVTPEDREPPSGTR